MIHVEGLTKRASPICAGIGVRSRPRQFRCLSRRDLWFAGAQWRGKDDVPQDPQHGAPSHRRPRDDRPVTTSPNIPPKFASCIGFMSGNTGVYDRMTAWELVEYTGVVRDARRPAERRLEELFRPCRCHDFRDTLGPRCRRECGRSVDRRTIIHDPPVMIFDEPRRASTCLSRGPF